MQVVEDPTEARRLCVSLPRPIGFVPTMGALHAGHLSLLEAARKKTKSVVASVFVNQLQFGAGEDFERYPRDFESDLQKLEDGGVDVAFVPASGSVYPADFSTRVDAGSIGNVFEGAIRPGHFIGVATVIVKLLNIVMPDVLLLGQKDAQQTAVLGRVVRDLNVPVKVTVEETTREPDGLACSSRNFYLNEAQRAAAPSLYRALVALRDAMQQGILKEQAITRARETLSPLASPDYFDVVDATTFAPLDDLRANAFVIGAARFGTTRLIDNLWVRP
jgi:pantoate--beta-alanine ligase